MLRALLLAFDDLFDPRLRRYLWLSILGALALFAVLWSICGVVLARADLVHHWALQWTVDLLGGLVALAATWLLFPSVVLVVLGFFLDRVVTVIEDRRYPDLPPAREPPWLETLWIPLRLGLLALILNILALPIYAMVWLNLIIPGSTIALFYALNGYLAGREYFELVALRRLGDREARAMRRRHAGGIFLGGVVIAFLLTIPLVNLAAPLLGAALMLHVFERWRRLGESR